MGIPEVGDWPKVLWELLDPTEMVRIRDLERLVELRKDSVDGDVYFGGGREEADRPYYAKGAVLIGCDAWREASRLRHAAGVPAFVFPSGTWNFAEFLELKLAEFEEAELRPDVDLN